MLPGKLCIGILEEDNPQKSYFRLKPLLVENEGKYEYFDSTALYPEDGCIRIVPDKNESGRFKVRMRRMGRYCILDLRQHTGENDKIRPNKNYNGDEFEHNAHIVYSDVVREPVENMIYEIIAAAPDGSLPSIPGTARVLPEGTNEIWKCVLSEDGESGHIERDSGEISENDVQRFDVPGFSGETLHFVIRLPNTAEPASPQPAVSEPLPEEQAQPADKPWISHDLPEPPIPAAHMSPMQMNLAAQSGLNPRRNRSLHEIIEEKWRHSRVDQLGHPVPANATGHPVVGPVENAVNAVREAWQNPEVREQLIDRFAKLSDIRSLIEQKRHDESTRAIRRDLEDLEAERLFTLGEIDRLHREKAELRETFKNEIRVEEAETLREVTEKTRIAKEECALYQKQANDAKQAAEFARDALASLTDGRFEEKLREFALTSRAAKYLARPSVPRRNVAISEDAPSREEWIARTLRAFRTEGLEISEIEAANLLICAALSNSLLLAGPASADKRGFARALARALGAYDAKRFAEIHSSVSADRPEWVGAPSEVAGVLLIPSANQIPVLDSICEGGTIITLSAIAGGAFPVPAEVFENGFMLTLEPVGADSAWQTNSPKTDFSVVRMQTLRDAFLSSPAEIPPALERRLQRVREALAEYGVFLSRHTLNLMWQYCGAMLALGKVSAGEALDRAFAQKALPCILAEAPVSCLRRLPVILVDFPRSLALLEKPLPIQI